MLSKIFRFPYENIMISALYDVQGNKWKSDPLVGEQQVCERQITYSQRKRVSEIFSKRLP